jgi:hypothetical protein
MRHRHGQVESRNQLIFPICFSFKVINMSDEEFLLWHEFASDDLIDEIREIEIEYEKQQRKEERDKEKERIKVEKHREKEYLKELKKPKEDLEFDKQTELPKPLEISTIIPTHLFGDALMIIEFLKCFGDFFELHVDFPNGFCLGLCFFQNFLHFSSKENLV